MAYKYAKPKFWQILWKLSPGFIRHKTFWNKYGNPLSRRLIVTCDYCGLSDLARKKHQFPHWAGSHGKFNDSELCIPCYEIHKLLRR